MLGDRKKDNLTRSEKREIRLDSLGEGDCFSRRKTQEARTKTQEPRLGRLREVDLVLGR